MQLMDIFCMNFCLPSAINVLMSTEVPLRTGSDYYDRSSKLLNQYGLKKIHFLSVSLQLTGLKEDGLLKKA